MQVYADYQKYTLLGIFFNLFAIWYPIFNQLLLIHRMTFSFCFKNQVMGLIYYIIKCLYIKLTKFISVNKYKTTKVF